MILASQLRAGMAIRFEQQLYKVASCNYHPGQGKMGGASHARLQNLSTGTFWEHSFRAELKIEEVPVEKVSMQFLYQDADQLCFMNPEDFEQISLPASLLGPQAPFLRPEMTLPVEFVEGRPVSVAFPDILEVRIDDTSPPSHQQQDGPWKPAKLENGVEVMVPPFIKAGDWIRLDLPRLRYMDRAKGAGR